MARPGVKGAHARSTESRRSGCADRNGVINPVGVVAGILRMRRS